MSKHIPKVQPFRIAVAALLRSVIILSMIKDKKKKEMIFPEVENICKSICIEIPSNCLILWFNYINKWQKWHICLAIAYIQLRVHSSSIDCTFLLSVESMDER